MSLAFGKHLFRHTRDITISAYERVYIVEIPNLIQEKYGKILEIKHTEFKSIFILEAKHGRCAPESKNMAEEIQSLGSVGAFGFTPQ
jgi:hypothetical protein